MGPYKAWISEMLQPAMRSTSALNSTKGRPRSWASCRPNVDLPAPRRPIRAMCCERSWLWVFSPRLCAMAMRAWCNSGSLRFCNSSRINNHSGVAVVTSPNNSASGHCKAVATSNKIKMDALPVPDSRLAKWRCDTWAASATARRVRPRRERSKRTRSPKATKKGCRSDGGAASTMDRL